MVEFCESIRGFGVHKSEVPIYDSIPGRGPIEVVNDDDFH